MNVSLIYPLLSRSRSLIDENKQYWPPLGIAYIAAVLEKNGHKVNIIDRDALLRKNSMDFDRADRETEAAIESINSDIVGIGGTTPTISDVFYVAKIVKSHNPKRIVITGGPHVTAEPESTLKDCDYIDGVVRGEGEFTMLDLASGMPFDLISGLTYRDKGQIFSNADRPLFQDMDSLPLPARHLLDMKFYTRPSRYISRNLNLRSTSIFTARGCPYQCNFCAGPLFYGRKVRFHSPQRVMQEIRTLIDMYAIEGLYFAEDMFLSDKARAQKFMELFKENKFNKKIKWFAQLRTNIVDRELLDMMKDSGCVQVEYGFESGSQRILDLMGKNVKVEKNIQAARITRSSGLRFQGNIITGYPGETEEDFNKTLKFLWKVRPNTISLNLFMPLPGTSVYKMLKEKSMQVPSWDVIGDPEGFNFNYADMPHKRFERLYMKARISTVLPINLFYFIKYNLNNPIRLFKMLATQFRGVAIKLVRDLYRSLHE
ncbi:MAG: hypothetical protein COZ98_03065 [Candidatus Omnitrophica bacterium CG_4_8_14_3_um_filter_43_15]|nr:MAG: hypothetical protein COZ98_03065 [Candidatus Omnitrophica bacterium CG_4_8_14_3_um_filter_43_15]